MKVISAQPYIWHQLSDGHLIPPFALYGNGRMFIATDEGLLEITCPKNEPEFRPERGDLIWPLLSDVA